MTRQFRQRTTCFHLKLYPQVRFVSLCAVELLKSWPLQMQMWPPSCHTLHLWPFEPRLTGTILRRPPSVMIWARSHSAASLKMVSGETRNNPADVVCATSASGLDNCAAPVGRTSAFSIAWDATISTSWPCSHVHRLGRPNESECYDVKTSQSPQHDNSLNHFFFLAFNTSKEMQHKRLQLEMSEQSRHVSPVLVRHKTFISAFT